MAVQLLVDCSLVDNSNLEVRACRVLENRSSKLAAGTDLVGMVERE